MLLETRPCSMRSILVDVADRSLLVFSARCCRSFFSFRRAAVDLFLSCADQAVEEQERGQGYQSRAKVFALFSG